jgi:general secretion pathway protein C
MFGLTRGFEGLWSTLSGSKVGHLRLFVQMLSGSVPTNALNLAVIGMVVYMLMSSGLDGYKASLEDEIVLSGHDHVAEQIKPETRSGSRSQRLDDYGVIAARDLFGTARQSVKEESEKEEVKIEEMPLASLQLKLMGTVVASDPAMRTAIIAEANGRNERMYREGESVKGATIKKILRYAVVLNTGQRDEVLKMESAESGKQTRTDQRSDQSANRTPVQVVTLDRKDVQESLEDIPGLFKSARFERYRSGGINGFKVRSMARNSAFSKLGLRSNDIILGVNGAPITNLNQATSLYDELEKGGQVSVNIKRFGRQRDIALRLK